MTHDRDLLLLGVAVDADHFHPVEERCGDGLEHVCRRDEQHVRKVELDFEVVIAEGVVLRRVEHFEQCRRGVAAEVRPDLVDLVEHDDGVHGAGLVQGRHEATGLRADVGAPVAADLGLVVHAAERDTHEAASEGARHGFAE